jgi:hypothetical protein
VTGKPLRLASAVLDHCHRTGRVRAVVHRSANAAEGGRYVGRTCGVSATNKGYDWQLSQAIHWYWRVISITAG